MTLFHAPSVQSPAAYSNQNLQGAQLAIRMAASASAAQRLNLRTAIQDVLYTYAIHPAETSAGLVDANINFGTTVGTVDRYGTNTSPGVTDMHVAIQNAINVALAAISGGFAGVPVRFLANAYATSVAPTFGGASALLLPLDIGGSGPNATQIVYTAAAGTGALWDFTGRNGWYLHDMSILCTDTHHNDGIYCGTGAAEQIMWRVERVDSWMFGKGMLIKNTNTGQVDRFRHWPAINFSGQFAQQAATVNVSDGIYISGGFANNLTIKNCVLQPSGSFAVGQVGIRLDATFSYGLRIADCDLESGDGAAGHTGLLLAAGNAAIGASIENIYHEKSILSFSNIQQSKLGPFVDGGIGGQVTLLSTCRFNTLVGISPATGFVISDATSVGNVRIGCGALTSDGSEGANLSNQPNIALGSAGQADQGKIWRKTVSVAAAGTFNPDAHNAEWYTIRAAGSLTIVAPLNPTNGKRFGFTIRNESAGAIVVTWSGFNSPPWVNPAAGQKRSAEFIYDSDFNTWDFVNYSVVDSLN